MLPPSEGDLKKAIVSSTDKSVKSDIWGSANIIVPSYIAVTAENRVNAVPKRTFVQLNHPIPLFTAEEWRAAEGRFFARGRVSEYTGRYLYPIREDPTEEEEESRNIHSEEEEESRDIHSEEDHGTEEKFDEENVQQMFGAGKESLKDMKSPGALRGNVNFTINPTEESHLGWSENGDAHSRSSALVRHESHSVTTPNYLPSNEAVQKDEAVRRLALNAIFQGNAVVSRGKLNLESVSFPKTGGGSGKSVEKETIPVKRQCTPCPKIPMFVHLRCNNLRRNETSAFIAKHSFPSTKDNKNMREDETHGRINFTTGNQKLEFPLREEISSVIEEDTKICESKESARAETSGTLNSEKLLSKKQGKNESSISVIKPDPRTKEVNTNKRVFETSYRKPAKPQLRDKILKTKSKPSKNDDDAPTEKEVNNQGGKRKPLPKSISSNRAEVSGIQSTKLTQKDSVPAPKEINKSVEPRVQFERRAAVQSKLPERALTNRFSLNNNLGHSRNNPGFSQKNNPSIQFNTSVSDMSIEGLQSSSQSSILSFDEESTKYGFGSTNEIKMTSDFPQEQICSQKFSQIGNKLHRHSNDKFKPGRTAPVMKVDPFGRDRRFSKDEKLSFQLRSEVRLPERLGAFGMGGSSQGEPIKSSAGPPLPSEIGVNLRDFASQDQSHLLMNERPMQSSSSSVPQTSEQILEETAEETYRTTKRKMDPNYTLKNSKAPREVSNIAVSRSEKITLPRNITFGKKKNVSPFPSSASQQKLLTKAAEENSSVKPAVAKGDVNKNPNSKQSPQIRKSGSEISNPTVDLKASTSSKTFLARTEGTASTRNSPLKSCASVLTATNLRRRISSFPKKEYVVSNVTLVPKLSDFRFRLTTPSKNPSYKTPRRKLTESSRNLLTGKSAALSENRSKRNDVNPSKLYGEFQQMEQRGMHHDLLEPSGDMNKLVEDESSFKNGDPKATLEMNHVLSTELIKMSDGKQLSSVLHKKQNEGNDVKEKFQAITKGTEKTVLSEGRLKFLPSKIPDAKIIPREINESKSEIAVTKKSSFSDAQDKHYSEFCLPTAAHENSQLDKKAVKEAREEEIDENHPEAENTEMDLWKKRVEELLNKRLMTTASFDWYLSGEVPESETKPRGDEESSVKSASKRLAEIGTKLADMQKRKAAAQTRADNEETVTETDIVTKWQKATDCFYKEHTELKTESDTKLEKQTSAGKKIPAESRSEASLRGSDVKKPKRQAKDSSRSNNRTQKGKTKQKEKKEIHRKPDTTDWAEKIRPGLNDMNMAFLIQAAASLSKNMYGREQRQDTSFVCDSKKIEPLSKNYQQSVNNPVVTSKVENPVSQKGRPPEKRLSSQGVANPAVHRLISEGRRRILRRQVHQDDPVRVPPPGRRTFIDDILYPGYRSPPLAAKSATTLVKPSPRNKITSSIPTSTLLQHSPPVRLRKSRSIIKGHTPKKTSSKNIAVKGKSSTTQCLLPTNEKEAGLTFPNNTPLELETGTSTSKKTAKSRKGRKIRRRTDKRKPSTLSKKGTQTTPLPSTSNKMARIPSERTKKKKSGTKTQKVECFKKQFQLFAKCGDRRNTGNAITLANTKKWLKQAGLIDQKRVTGNDVETYFIHYTGRLRSLPLVDFLQFLRTLAAEKGLSVQQITELLLSCGAPLGNTTDMVIAAMFEDPQKAVTEQDASAPPPTKCASPKRRRKQKVVRRKCETMEVATLVENTTESFSGD